MEKKVQITESLPWIAEITIVNELYFNKINKQKNTLSVYLNIF